MNKCNFKEGQKLWKFDFDAGRKEWAVYQVTFLRQYRSACMIGDWCVVVNSDGASDDIPADELFESREDAIKALLKCIGTVRSNIHQDIDYHTKEIAKDWNEIDFCTDLIEQLEKQQ